MTAWFDDLLAFEDAVLRHGTLEGGVCPNYPVETALDIYRNNYRGNLQGALALAYPVVGKIVGEDFFRVMARGFIEACPSKSGNLHDYGAEFGDFAQNFAPAKALPYLADMAKLEWACHRAYFAEDEKPLDVSALAGVSPESLARLRFLIHSGCRVVKSEFPVVAIWQAHQLQKDFHVDLDIGAQNALVSRKSDAVLVTELRDGETQWLERIRAGDPLGAVTAATLGRHPDFDLQSFLADLILREILTDFEIETEEMK